MRKAVAPRSLLRRTQCRLRLFPIQPSPEVATAQRTRNSADPSERGNDPLMDRADGTVSGRRTCAVGASARRCLGERGKLQLANDQHQRLFITAGAEDAPSCFRAP
jgi:hypothetical protein